VGQFEIRFALAQVETHLCRMPGKEERWRGDARVLIAQTDRVMAESRALLKQIRGNSEVFDAHLKTIREFLKPKKSNHEPIQSHIRQSEQGTPPLRNMAREKNAVGHSKYTWLSRHELESKAMLSDLRQHLNPRRNKANPANVPSANGQHHE
jgi:hypothetical protein